MRTEQLSGTSALLVAVHPVDARIVWASGARGTRVRTTDGGTTWRTGRVPGADILQFRDVFALDSTTAFVLGIGNGERSRIYQTVDGGATWTAIDAANYWSVGAVSPAAAWAVGANGRITKLGGF